MKFSQQRDPYTSITTSTSSLNKTSNYFTIPTSRDVSFQNRNAFTLILSCLFSLNKEKFERGLLYSNPTFNHTNDKVTIHLFYFIFSQSARINAVNFSTTDSVLSFNENLSSLSNTLAQLYQKEVSLVLTRIHYPYLNSAIFSQYLVHNANSNTFVHFKNSILTYPSRNASKLPAYVSGIKIEVSGRLLTERVVPRITIKRSLFGSFSGSSIVDYGKYTTKNDLGAFTIKV